MSDDQDSGPAPETLNRLIGMLPEMAKGVATRKLYGRGMKVGPSKFCAVCEQRFGDKVRMENQELLESLCDKCRPMLEQGYTALRFGSQYRFGKFPQWPDRAGQIVPITSKKMWDGIEKFFKAHFVKPGDEPSPAG